MKSHQASRRIPWVAMVVVGAMVLNEAPTAFARAHTIVPCFLVPITLIGAVALWRHAARHAASGWRRVLVLTALAGGLASVAHAGRDFAHGFWDGLAGNPSAPPEAYATTTHFVAWALLGVAIGLVLDRLERRRFRALDSSRALSAPAADGRH